MSKTVLIIHAQPEPTSLTRHLVGASRQSLQAQGHTVLESDLYAMRWKAVFDADDFPQRADPERLSFGADGACRAGAPAPPPVTFSRLAAWDR